MVDTGMEGLPLMMVALAQAKTAEERTQILNSFDKAALEGSPPVPQNTMYTKEKMTSSLAKVLENNTEEGWKAYLKTVTLEVLEATPSFEACLEETFHTETNQTRVYSAMCSMFDRLKGLENKEKVPLKVKDTVALWTPICKGSPVLSQFLNSAVSRFLDGKADDALAAVTSFEGADVNSVCSALASCIDLRNFWVLRDSHDPSVARVLTSAIASFEQRLADAMVEHHRRAILSTLCVENWESFRPNRYKFQRCTPTVSMWVVNMVGMVGDEDGLLCLSDEKVRVSVLAKVFLATFETITNFYCRLPQHLSRGRWTQLRVDVLTLVCASMAFLKSKRLNLFQLDGFSRALDGHCTTLLGLLALLDAPVDAVIGSLSSMASDQGACYKYPSAGVKSLCEFLGVEEIVAAKAPLRFMSVSSSFCSLCGIEGFCTVEIGTGLWKALLEELPFSKKECLSIVSMRHELGSFDYPPLAEGQESDKAKLRDFLGVG